MEPTSTTSPDTSKPAFNTWRALSVFLAIVVVFAVATGMSMFEQFKAQIDHLQKQLVAKPQIKYLSVLNDAQGTPGLLVTFDPSDKQLVLQRLGSVVEGREDALQLWAFSGQGQARSLGLLARGVKTLRLAGDEAQLQGVEQLGVSAENVGGVTDTRGPSLPLLFKGAWIQKAL
jgi:anti-sigma-K factor RskA